MSKVMLKNDHQITHYKVTDNDWETVYIVDEDELNSGSIIAIHKCFDHEPTQERGYLVKEQGIIRYKLKLKSDENKIIYIPYDFELKREIIRPVFNVLKFEAKEGAKMLIEIKYYSNEDTFVYREFLPDETGPIVLDLKGEKARLIIEEEIRPKLIFSRLVCQVDNSTKLDK